jgi:hypothetical protein
MVFILDDILLAPCKLATSIGKALYRHAVEEMTDDSPVRQGLLELQEQFELGQITQDEFLRREDALMQQLDRIRQNKESMRAR